MITITCDFNGCEASAEIDRVGPIVLYALHDEGNYITGHPDERIPDCTVSLPEAWHYRWSLLRKSAVFCPIHAEAVPSRGGWKLPRVKMPTFRRGA